MQLRGRNLTGKCSTLLCGLKSSRGEFPAACASLYIARATKVAHLREPRHGLLLPTDPHVFHRFRFEVITEKIARRSPDKAVDAGSGAGGRRSRLRSHGKVPAAPSEWLQRRDQIASTVTRIRTRFRRVLQEVSNPAEGTAEVPSHCRLQKVRGSWRQDGTLQNRDSSCSLSTTHAAL